MLYSGIYLAVGTQNCCVVLRDILSCWYMELLCCTQGYSWLLVQGIVVLYSGINLPVVSRNCCVTQEYTPLLVH